jgi:spore maturation protein CgeB
MRVLYVGLLYNYGKKDEGFSYEHNNLEAGFRECANEGLFDLDLVYPDACENLAQTIMEFVIDGNIDCIFHVAFNEDLDLPEEVAKLALRRDIPIIQWDCDSSWRYPSWIRPRKERVSHFVTTHSQAVPWYERDGLKVMKSQWGGSPRYIRKETDSLYDVSFIGQKHGRRPNGSFVRAEAVDALLKADIDIHLFGSYWDGYESWHGYLTNFQGVLDVFNASKICLNLSNPWHVGTLPQIKGRHFEIPQIQAFQICTPADDLESYFEADKEIVIVRSLPEMIDKIKYYLTHDNERLAIAKAGRDRMLAEHQWSHRFQHIFGEFGLL